MHTRRTCLSNLWFHKKFKCQLHNTNRLYWQREDRERERERGMLGRGNARRCQGLHRRVADSPISPKKKPSSSLFRCFAPCMLLISAYVREARIVSNPASLARCTCNNDFDDQITGFVANVTMQFQSHVISSHIWPQCRNLSSFRHDYCLPSHYSNDLLN